MGLISLPVMLRYGYNRRLATGVIAAAGTLAQIIPPSLVLIVLADQLACRSAICTGGRCCPAWCSWGCTFLYVLATTIAQPAAAPALPPEARTLRGMALARRAAVSMLPPLVLIFLVLGTIFLGIATPTKVVRSVRSERWCLPRCTSASTSPAPSRTMDSTMKLTSFVVSS